MARLDPVEIVEDLSLARLLWLRRNSFIFGREFTNPATWSSRPAVTACQEANLQSERQGVVREPSILQWAKPEVGWVKLNWDAALSLATQIEDGGRRGCAGCSGVCPCCFGYNNSLYDRSC